MFEIGWTEMLVIAIVMIVVVGPKDLPRMLRTFGKTTAKLRSMAGDFQRQFNEALKEAELDEVKKSVDSLRSLDPAAEIRKQLNPFEQAASDIRSGLDSLNPSAAPSAEAEAHAADPLKNGPAALPELDADPASKPAGATSVPKAEPALVGATPAASAVKAAETPSAAVSETRAKPAAKAAPGRNEAKSVSKSPAKPKAAAKPATARKKTSGTAK